MNLTRILIGAVFVLVLVVAGSFGYQLFLAPVDPTPTPVPIETEDVPINAEGRVVPSRQAAMALELAGRIKRINVEAGDFVEEGDLLIELDSETLEAQVEQAQAALEAALAQQDMLPERASDEDEDLAQANVDQARAALRAAESALDRSRLTAPFAGRIISVDVVEGEVAAVGMPVVLLADTSDWQVETLDVLEEDAVHLRLGQSAEVELAAYPDQELTGSVQDIALNASSYQGNVTYTVTVGLPSNLDLDLSWGMTAFVTMNRFEARSGAAENPTRTPAETATDQPTIAAQETTTATSTPSPTPSGTTSPEAGEIIHIVQEEENLFRISLQYGVSVEALRQANDLEDNLIYVGQRLLIPEVDG